MSGTSLDGVDAVLVDFSTERPVVLGHSSGSFPENLKAELGALNAAGDNEIHRAALAANGLARVYAEQVHRVLALRNTKSSNVRAIGAHGQTIRHRPQEFDGTGYTIQLNNAALLAELCAINVVADFRTRDVAAGGQGAPLVPPFHQAVFGRADAVTAVLNLGGISNITILDPHASALIGFDCGPANVLLDSWCHTHTAQPFDHGGRWAAQGRVNTTLLQHLLDEPYFSRSPPKSTGRDMFNPAWLTEKIKGFGEISPVDIQATLTELTALSCASSLKSAAPACSVLSVCGGGAANGHMMSRLQAALPGCAVQSSEAAGIPPQQVEAAAFAWLARQTILGQTGSVGSVTGAKGARILGAVYPA
jgi:anhydro-N-acetylmuramic acid kinase